MTIAIGVAPHRRPHGSRQLAATLVVISFGVAGCSSAAPTDEGVATAATVVDSATFAGATDAVDRPVTSPSAPAVETAIDTTTPATTVPAATSQIGTTSTSEATSSATTALLPTTPYLVPLADVEAAGWGDGHSGYPATDIFAACGSEIVSPVDGVLAEIRTVDSWNPDVDDPATRGGRSVTIIGDDGVRYYLAHLDDVDRGLVVGERVSAGRRLGTVGLTGRTSGCHVHFGISPPCPGKEWSVRRGAIPPKPYLDAWREGRRASPLGEVLRWAGDNPRACEQAMNDPFAADA